MWPVQTEMSLVLHAHQISKTQYQQKNGIELMANFLSLLYVEMMIF